MCSVSIWVTIYGRTAIKISSKLGSTMKISMIDVNTPIIQWHVIHCYDHVSLKCLKFNSRIDDIHINFSTSYKNIINFVMRSLN